MASTFEQVSNHMILHDVSWEAYTKFLDALGDRRLRHSYDDGTLEMVSPLKDHEWVKCLIGRFLEAASLELNIPIQSIGSTALRRDRMRKGFEPDACYYIFLELRTTQSETALVRKVVDWVRSAKRRKNN
jgi:Uma2 family endonuclease